VVDAPVDALVYGLKLDAEQTQKITAVLEQFRKERDGLLPRPGGAPPGPGELPEAAAKVQSLQQQAERQVNALLTPDQRRALTPTLDTLRSLRAVGLAPELFGMLELTAGQRKAIGAFAQEVLGALLPPAQPGGGAGATPQAIRQAQDQARKKALAALTSDQRRVAEAYLKAHPQPAFDVAAILTPPSAVGTPAGPPGLADARPVGGGAAAGVAAAGREVFLQKCQGCHGAQGQGGRTGPALAGVGRKFAAADVRQLIANGRNRMPAFGGQLSAAQLDAVSGYVRGLGGGR
jgi:mono/diheme cytochrome c family protein